MCRSHSSLSQASWSGDASPSDGDGIDGRLADRGHTTVSDGELLIGSERSVPHRYSPTMRRRAVAGRARQPRVLVIGVAFALAFVVALVALTRGGTRDRLSVAVGSASDVTTTTADTTTSSTLPPST